MSIQFIESKRFIESFDSVRHVPTGDHIERKIHAEIELMLSLLFGERMVVPEPYSFDSLGFLYIATNVLDKRPRLRKNSPVWYPFLLALRRNLQGHSSYRGMVADLLTRPNFILSAWPEITDDMTSRNQLAQYIAKGNYREAQKHFDAEKVERLERLDAYFSEVDLSDAVQPTIPLNRYIDWLAKVDETTVAPELQQYTVALKTTVDTLEKAGINFTNRSEVRLKGQNILAPDIFKMILEYVDSCYNHVVASSVRATTSIFSTRGPGENLYVRAGEELALRSTSLESADDSCNRLSLWITPEDDLRKGLTATLEIWDKIWAIVTHEDWLQSVKKLHDALPIRSDDQRTQAEEALDAHITLLARKLGPLSIKLEGEWVKVTGAAAGAIAGEEIAKVLEYSFGLPLPVGTGAAIGSFLGWGTATGLKQGEKWWVEGSIWRSLWRSVNLR